MYYFEILKILEDSKKPLNALEIFAAICRKREANMRSVTFHLRKIYLKVERVDREERLISKGDKAYKEFYYYVNHINDK